MDSFSNQTRQTALEVVISTIIATICTVLGSCEIVPALFSVGQAVYDALAIQGLLTLVPTAWLTTSEWLALHLAFPAAIAGNTVVAAVVVYIVYAAAKLAYSTAQKMRALPRPVEAPQPPTL
eukprot:TRINITY_DN11694_c0_g1_i1.p5 TRINITY_DN11694_c0_g1~~TRINITY_DN11694_c0_g1_i1.p5  ORF type:complete len:122 (+),score=17.95 TRINITY_DN11694_c0_g1_i1:781-1146(+)